MKASGLPALIVLAAVAAACLVPPPSLARSLPDFTGLVERNRAAVVNISTRSETHV